VCVVTGVDSENNTIVLGQALLHDEKVKSWQFVLESLKRQSDGICPDILWTDEDAAIPAAILNAYGQNSKVVHLLCDWHIRGNVKKKLNYNEVRKKSKLLEDAFFKAQHSQSETAYEANMQDLLMKSEPFPALVRYFNTMRSDKVKWCHAQLEVPTPHTAIDGTIKKNY
jgi:hypothetical protein